jgi:hypothetical protein
MLRRGNIFPSAVCKDLFFALFCGPDGRVSPNSSKHNQINRDRESFPMSAAERFYGRALKVQPQVRPSDEMQKELAQPRHRYYCVHQYLQAHPDLTVVELGFGEPEIAAALAQICRSYRIVDEAMSIYGALAGAGSNLGA